MFNLFSKMRLATSVALLTVSTSVVAWDDCCDPCDTSRTYIGVFGGGLWSDSTRITQMGTAFFPEGTPVFGPLDIVAEGRTKKKSTGFAGVQLGYEWSQTPCFGSCSGWTIAPAFEIEAFFFRKKISAHLVNDPGITRLTEHDFEDSFKMKAGVLMVNALVSFNSSCMYGFTPYVGGGIGAARISLKDADSLQVSPPEPGINHFNSRRDDSCWAFAAQAKAGLRYNFCGGWHVFGEYRYLFVDNSNYVFGSTVYPAHVPTSPWNVKLHNTNHNAFVAGIQFDL
ncbi:MAG: outer membrane beta-barrel protein [Parachlamydiaceae bacterium]|nr:outer membrane beta-barrel protein [Parachlamydiaceae bacterium]